MLIDDLLPPSPEFVDEYHKTIAIGKEYCKSLDIVFVGLARNLESKIYDNINWLESVGTDLFKNSDIVVFENDSDDSTKSILGILQKMLGNKLHLLMNNFGASFFNSAMPIDRARSNERTTNLADYRNTCRSYIKNNLAYKNYIIVLDLDFKEISINGLLHSFGVLATNKNIKSVVGNSYELKHIFNPEKYNLWNYDSWAFRKDWWLDKSLEVSWYDPMLWFGFWIPSPGLPTIKVNSAFGGMAIYRCC